MFKKGEIWPSKLLEYNRILRFCKTRRKKKKTLIYEDSDYESWDKSSIKFIETEEVFFNFVEQYINWNVLEEFWFFQSYKK